MTTQYKFDFSRMTQADVDAGKNCQTFADFTAIVARLYVGDFDAISPFEMMVSVAPAFMLAFKEWTRTVTVAELVEQLCSNGEADNANIDDDAVRDMLDGIEGL